MISYLATRMPKTITHISVPTHAVDRRGRDETGQSYFLECGEF